MFRDLFENRTFSGPFDPVGGSGLNKGVKHTKTDRDFQTPRKQAFLPTQPSFRADTRTDVSGTPYSSASRNFHVLANRLSRRDRSRCHAWHAFFKR